jgi:hypothetical protein
MISVEYLAIMCKKVMEKTATEVIKETCHKKREENKLKNLQLTSLHMNMHLNVQLPKCKSIF